MESPTNQYMEVINGMEQIMEQIMDQRMDDSFKEAVRAAVEERVGAEVMVTPVRKNNGLMLTGLVIRSSGNNTAPTFYLESIRPEKRTMDRVEILADEIVAIIQNNQETGGLGNAAETMNRILGDTEELKSRVYPRVVNYAWNEEILQGLPHRRFLDLAITYDIEIATGASCRVRNEMMEIISLSEDDLYEAAIRNIRLRSYQIMTMADMLDRAGVEMGVNIRGAEEGMPLVVITNPSGINGAYGIIDEELLEHIYHRFGFGDHRGLDFFSIPSSVHEILVTPAQSGAEGEYLNHIKSMVREVNENNVALEERLSDSVYIYEKHRGVRIA